jgi:hypothetical protein
MAFLSGKLRETVKIVVDKLAYNQASTQREDSPTRECHWKQLEAIRLGLAEPDARNFCPFGITGPTRHAPSGQGCARAGPMQKKRKRSETIMYVIHLPCISFG